MPPRNNPQLAGLFEDKSSQPIEFRSRTRPDPTLNLPIIYKGQRGKLLRKNGDWGYALMEGDVGVSYVELALVEQVGQNPGNASLGGRVQ